MQSNNAAQVPNPRRAGQKVEVVLEGQEGGERVALRYLTWTEGLGWCCQKTIRLDADQLEELHHAITVARHRINRQRAESGHEVRTAQVIRLPSLA